MNQSHHLIAQIFFVAFIGSLTGSLFSFINSSVWSISIGTGIGGIMGFFLNKYVFHYLANISLSLEIGSLEKFKHMNPLAILLALVSVIAACSFHFPFVKFMEIREGYEPFEPMFFGLSFAVVCTPFSMILHLYSVSLDQKRKKMLPSQRPKLHWEILQLSFLTFILCFCLSVLYLPVAILLSLLKVDITVLVSIVPLFIISVCYFMFLSYFYNMILNLDERR